MRFAHKSLAVISAGAILIGIAPAVSHAAPAAAASVIGHLYPLAPVRLLDTRTGNGAPTQPLGPNGTLHLQVTGRGGVPSTGVSAVVLNVTVDAPSAQSFLSVYPTGIPRPDASNLNFTAGWVGANSVTVPVGANGQIDIWNLTGNVQVIADVTGFYAGTEDPAVSGPGGQFYPNDPWRAVDTRNPEDGGPLTNGDWIDIAFGYTNGTINPHIRAVALNITAVGANASGFLTAWSGAGPIPNASTLNYTKGAIVPNMAIIPTRACDASWCGTATVARVQNTTSGSTNVFVDVVGFFDDGTLGDGDNFHALTPTRITDTREGKGIAQPFGSFETKTQSLNASPLINPAVTDAVVSNVTGITPTKDTFLTLWAPFDGPEVRPDVSMLNLKPGDIRPNAVIIGIDFDNKFAVYNHYGTTNIAIDVSGRFDYAPATTLGAKAMTASEIRAAKANRPRTGVSSSHAG